MASVNGISLKAIREMIGEEGPYYSADVCLGGRKVAAWSQDSRGGITDNLYMVPGYSETELLEAVKRAMPVTPTDLDRPLDPEDGFLAESFFPALVDLEDNEKQYAKCKKEGFSVMVMATDGMHYNYVFFSDPAVGRMSIEEISEKYPKEYGSLLRKMFKNPGFPVFHIYSSEADFEIGSPEDMRE